MRSTLALAACLLASSTARAGFIEIGASGGYKRSVIDVDSYQESTTLTGSLAYYFNESSSIELSYTDGKTKNAVAEGNPFGHITTVTYSLIGFDFVYTFGERESGFRPYVKVGTNYILEKRIVDQYRDGAGTLYPANVIEDDPALVPSAGVGFRVSLTKNLSLKVGVDAWTSRPVSESPVTVDYMGRLGLSFMF